MKLHHTHTSLRLVLLSVLLILAFVLAPVAPVSAALRSCRTDPIVIFTDGTKLSISASVGTEMGNIREIVYLLHVPQGMQVKQIVFTAGKLGQKEVVAIATDEVEGNFTTDTIVYTHTGGVDVTATSMLMVGVASSASGHDNEHLLNRLSAPGQGPRAGYVPDVH